MRPQADSSNRRQAVIMIENIFWVKWQSVLGYFYLVYSRIDRASQNGNFLVENVLSGLAIVLTLTPSKKRDNSVTTLPDQGISKNRCAPKI
jgi:hypothetical protein